MAELRHLEDYPANIVQPTSESRYSTAVFSLSRSPDSERRHLPGSRFGPAAVGHRTLKAGIQEFFEADADPDQIQNARALAKPPIPITHCGLSLAKELSDMRIAGGLIGYAQQRLPHAFRVPLHIKTATISAKSRFGSIQDH